MGKVYAWKDKKLFRLPYCSNLKWYGLIECAKWSDKGYFLGKHMKSFSQLKAMTTNIDIVIQEHKHRDTPF